MSTFTMAEWDDWRFAGGGAWNDWMALNATTLRAVQQRAGAYVLGLPRRQGGHVVRRLLAQDRHGILDIGESGDLKHRLSALLRCMTTHGERGHMAGWRLGTGGLIQKLGVQPEEFLVSWCYAATRIEAYNTESMLMRAYFELFGELPPLNYKFNWATWVDED